MAAFKRMLQVGIKVENCLMRYRAPIARSTSSSSSSLKEFSKKKMDLHPEHDEAGISLDEFKCRMKKLCKEMDSDVAEVLALVKKSEREMKDFYESEFVAMEKFLRKIAIGTVVCVNGAFMFASTLRSVKEDHGPSP